MDLYGRPRLAELLRELDQIEELDWIRILYNYPSYFTDELYEVLARSKRIIPYLDMPLQHINDRMLRMMNRRHTRAETEAIIARLRATIPGLVLRTTFIVGFPGETEAEFEELVEFVAATKFERLGVFSYSFEPDTPAARLPHQLAEDVKESRRDRVMAVQQPIAEAFNRSLVGRTLDVLIDAPAPASAGKNVWLGRTYADAPDVDGVTLRACGGPRHRRPGLLRDHRRPGPRPDRPAGEPRSDRAAPAEASTAQDQAQAAPEAAERLNDPRRDDMSPVQDPAERVATGPVSAQAEAPAKTQPRFWNVPNTLTVGRLVVAVFVFALISWEWYGLALAAFVIAALSDALDGYFARLLGQDTADRPAA